MISRRRLIGITKLVLGAIFFAQAALALAGCDWGRHAPAEVIAATVQMPCCDEDGASSDGPAGNPNLCFVHCTSDAQRVDTSGLWTAAFLPAIVPAVAPMPASACFALRRVPPAWHALAAPPLSLLFQPLRI